MNFRIICTVVLFFTLGLFLGKSVNSGNNPKLSHPSDPRVDSYGDAALDVLAAASSKLDPTVVNGLKQQLSNELSTIVSSILDSQQQQHIPKQQQQQQQTTVHNTRPLDAQSVVREQQTVNAATQLLHQLGLSDASAGFHFQYHTHERDAALPLCFTQAFAKSLEALCPNFFPGSVARPCTGANGWTCGRSAIAKATKTDIDQVRNTEEQSAASQLGCSNEFAPVCCRVGQSVHATANYCTCRRLGGQFVAPGSSCSSVRMGY